MAPSTDVVLAGTKAFALALFAPLTERVGSRPRIAPEPQQALALCAASSGLLLVEYAEAWLPVLRQLRAQAPGLRIVTALPHGQEAAALALAPLGIEAVPWDGQAAPILAAVAQVLGLGAAPSAAPPQGVAKPPAGPAAGPAPVAPRPTAPQLPRVPATTPAAGTPAVPAPPRVPATTPARPIPVAPAAPRVPATTPAAGTPAAPPLARPPATDLFDDLEPAEAEPAAPAAPTPAPYVPAPAAEEPPSAGDWPSGVPTEDEAESALVLYLRGKLRPEAPLAAVTGDAVRGMSELERQVIGGAALPFDGQPVYKAAVLRLRVAAALASVPAGQARVDDAAVQALLAELDAALALVNPLAAAAPPEHQPALEAIRNALVHEAVDFSEVAHRVSAGGPPKAGEVSRRPVARPGASAARVIKDQAGALEDEPEERRRRTPIFVLLAVLLLGGGYHAWNVVSRPQVVPPRTFDGAPAGTTSMVTRTGKYLVALAGQKVDSRELEQFKKREEARGNVVREVAPGRWVIEPAVPSVKEGKP